MTFTVIHRDGSRTDDPPLDFAARLLDELTAAPGRVAVRHATGWTLQVDADGTLEFGNDLDPAVAAVHRAALPAPALVELLQGVAVGSFYETLEHEWQAGPAPG